MTKKTIALIEPAFTSPYLYQAAVRHNVQLVCISETGRVIPEGDFPAVVAHAFVPMNKDPEQAFEQVAALHAQWKFDGIIAVREIGVIFAAMVNHRLGLRGVPVEAAKNARSKANMRRLFKEHGLVTPRFVNIANASEIDLCQEVPFPCVVKPASAFNSDGVTRVNNQTELLEACRRIDHMNETVYHAVSQVDGKSYAGIVVEEFLEGAEYAVELFSHNGEVHALNCGYKGHPQGPYFEETIYLSPPPNLPPEKIREIQCVAEAGMRALGIDNAPGHCELRLNGEGQPVILEIAARMGGGGMAQVNVQGANSIDYCRLWLASASDTMTEQLWPPKPDHSGRAGTSWILPMGGSGILKAVEGLDAVRAHPDCERLLWMGKIGHRYRPLPHFDDFLAIVLGVHASPAKAVEFFDFLEKTLHVIWEQPA